MLVYDIDSTHIDEGQGETVPFAFDGVNYEIELSDDNAAKLRTVLEEYTEKGRRVGRATGGRTTPRHPSSSTRKEDLSAARQWLRADGREVSERGRIAASFLEEYRANA